VSTVAHGGAPAGWLELSANLAPHGTPEAVRNAIARASYSAYADLDATAAERHLAAESRVDPSWVMLTAGATEALRLAMDALIEPGETVVIVGPTYGEYARVAARRGARVVEVRARPPDFAVPRALIARTVARERPRLVVACDPNNPTGRRAGRGAWDGVLEALPPMSDLVVDESFLPFATSDPRGLAGQGRAIVVRSLTKVLAIPGIRVGYVVAAPAILDRLRVVRDPWAVSAHACAVGAIATWKLDPAVRAEIARWRDALSRLFSERDLTPVPSSAPFVLVHAGSRCRPLVDAFGRRRIAVRRCASFGLPEHIRVAVRPPLDQLRIATVLFEEAW
jgi:histidinol-phosphate/aromatic aminotransferase/cobyric acid decarboxylase-like protein